MRGRAVRDGITRHSHCCLMTRRDLPCKLFLTPKPHNRTSTAEKLRGRSSPIRPMCCGPALLLAALRLRAAGNGCASERRADQAVKQMTYRLPVYRGDQWVGNLRKLVFLPVRIRRAGTFSMLDQDERHEARLTQDAAKYLSEQKGCEAVPVAGNHGAWRAQLSVTSDHGSLNS